MGLGGWMFNGMDPFTVLGASGNPDVPGLGFRYDTVERWALPGIQGQSVAVQCLITKSSGNVLPCRPSISMIVWKVPGHGPKHFCYALSSGASP